MKMYNYDLMKYKNKQRKFTKIIFRNADIFQGCYLRVITPALSLLDQALLLARLLANRLFPNLLLYLPEFQFGLHFRILHLICAFILLVLFVERFH